MAVTNNATLIEDMEGAGPTFTSIGGGAGASLNTDVFIAGSQSGGRRSDNVTGHGFWANPGATFDVSGEGEHVKFYIWQTHYTVVTAIDLRIGDSTTTYETHSLTVAEYPALGGWWPVWVQVDTGTDTSTPDFTIADEFAIAIDIGNVGGNAQNNIIDQIHHSTRPVMTWDGTTGTFSNFASTDTTNALGALLTINSVYFLYANLQIGSSTATTFTDSGVVIIAPEFSHLPTYSTWTGLDFDLQNASTVITWTDSVYGAAEPAGATRKPDLKVTGTSGTADFSDNRFDGLRIINLNSKVTCNGSVIANSGRIDPTNGDYTGFVDLPGTNEYVSTQETIDLSNISGDIEMVMAISPDDWTPTGVQSLMSHYGGTIATESFRLQLLTTGALRFIASDGTAETTYDSSAIPGTNTRHAWIRVLYQNSSPQATFHYSFDALDTPLEDISWTSAGTATGLYQLFPSISRVVLIGAENDGTPTGFFSGSVHYADIILEAYRLDPGGFLDGPNFKLIADWRTGQDFDTGATRPDDWDGTNYTWQLNGTSPTYTVGGNNSSAADLRNSTISSSTSVDGALLWDVNTDTDNLIDGVSFVSSGTGHGLVLGPNCPTSITLDGVTFTNYAGSNGLTGNEAILNRSNKSISVSIVGGGSTPTYRNMYGSLTTVTANVQITLTGMRNNTEVRVFAAGTTTAIAGIENATDGTDDARTFTFNVSSGQSIDINILHVIYEHVYFRSYSTTSNASLPISQRFDRSYSNP